MTDEQMKALDDLDYLYEKARKYALRYDTGQMIERIDKAYKRIRYALYEPDLEDDQNDNVEHPAHYTNGKYECIDVMIDVFGLPVVEDFCVCNAFKYIWRHQKKNELEDLRKAEWYLRKVFENYD